MQAAAFDRLQTLTSQDHRAVAPKPSILNERSAATASKVADARSKAGGFDKLTHTPSPWTTFATQLRATVPMARTSMPLTVDPSRMRAPDLVFVEQAVAEVIDGKQDVLRYLRSRDLGEQEPGAVGNVSPHETASLVTRDSEERRAWALEQVKHFNAHRPPPWNIASEGARRGALL
jgi:hypothetical protein